MKTTDHFRDDVIGPNRWPYREGITYEQCVRIVREARYTRWGEEERTWSIWGFAPEIRPPEGRYLVVTNAERDRLITRTRTATSPDGSGEASHIGGETMRIKYYEETDSAVVWLRERGPDTVGEIAGEDMPDPGPGSVVLHRDDAGELYGIEIYSGAGKRLNLDQIEFRRIPAGATAQGTRAEGKASTASS